MQLTKKSVVWGESGSVEKPNDVKIEGGWTGIPAEQPPAKWFNWILNSDEGNINDLIDANNVVDTELSNVITAAGLTPDLTPTGPGDQVETAIFSSGAIGTNALADDSVVDAKLGDDLDFGHFISGSISVTAGDLSYALGTTSLTIEDNVDTDNVVQAVLSREYGSTDTPTVLLSQKLAGVTKEAKLTHASLIISDASGNSVGASPSLGFTATKYGLQSRISSKGVKYSGSLSPGDITPVLRTAVFELDNGESWTESAGTNPSNWLWSGTISDCGIPNGSVIFLASISYKRTGLSGRRSAAVNLSDADGTTTMDLKLLSFMSYYSNEDPDTSEPQYLTVVYDASGL